MYQPIFSSLLGTRLPLAFTLLLEASFPVSRSVRKATSGPATDSSFIALSLSFSLQGPASLPTEFATASGHTLFQFLNFVLSMYYVRREPGSK